ncbi:unnamed protein product [Peronospora belbahrii]|uniref:YqaJ viral recombinase domain-containing protein n=1 Tax=Peronospora belbahrii TaxID=622444 RepID=A0AAU9LA96_9STRA|nr:unnamed protein product [Peronospora belbahrii]CAH0519170.1 unnamed protein product [Peronospora belbahrii]
MTSVQGSQAVETYLRNFVGETAHYKEILEITLCYGVQCLSRTCSLKGISCDKLRIITEYDTVKKQDFYVYNESQCNDKEGGRRQQWMPLEVKTKPSHAWRDGEVEMPEFCGILAVASSHCFTADPKSANDAMLYSLSPSFDEIAYLTKLLGKSFVDVMWKRFEERKGSQITTREAIDEEFHEIDQRKTVATLLPLEMPITSFTEFLGTYVTECVRQRTRSADNSESDNGEGVALNDEQENTDARGGVFVDKPSPSFVTSRRRNASTPSIGIANTHSHVDPIQKNHPLLRQLQPHQVTCSLQHVQSKIQPELQTRRQKPLRVKRTQSQRMTRDSLASARLAEYDARRELQNVRDGRLASKMFVRNITTGAAALEIVDGFMKSPLMDTFGRGDMFVSGRTTQTTDPTQPCSAQKDPLKQELCGATPFGDSSLGCEPELRHRSEILPKQRNCQECLDDFGPLHTKIVRPKWNKEDVTKSDSRTRKIKFEWNFEHVPRGNYETTDCPNAWTKFEEEASEEGIAREINHFVDDLGDTLSESSDLVFQWLEGAV